MSLQRQSFRGRSGVLRKVVMKWELIPPFHDLLKPLVGPETLDWRHACWWKAILPVLVIGRLYRLFVALQHIRFSKLAATFVRKLTYELSC